jgi:hypothetical protein
MDKMRGRERWNLASMGKMRGRERRNPARMDKMRGRERRNGTAVAWPPDSGGNSA